MGATYFLGNTVITVTGAVVLLAAVSVTLGWIAVWSGRNWRRRALALIIAALLIPISAFTFADLLGRPTRMVAAKLSAPGACREVLAARIHERDGIYLFVAEVAWDKKFHEPRYVFVPWNLKFAMRIQHAERALAEHPNGRIILGDQECQENARNGGKGKGNGKGGKGEGRDGQNGGRQGHPNGQHGSNGDGEEDNDVQFYPNPVPEDPPKDLDPFAHPPIVLPDR